jgi:xanthine dehydrogenase small subunit
VVAALRELQRAAGSTYAPTAGGRFHAPKTLAELAALREQLPRATLLAGGTDIGLWVNKQLRDLGEIVCLGSVDELRAIADDGATLRIGAGASLEDAWRALAARWPALTEMWLRFASPPVRNAGTMGGNVANGSPIGDSMPVLIALGASVILRAGESIRELPLEDFYLAYQKTALAPSEFVAAVRVPRRVPGTLVRAYKVSKRFDQDISAVFACFALACEGDRIVSARVGCGGVAPVPRRALATEAALAGKPWTDATAEAAARTLAAEFAPIDDMRASAAYRRAALANLLRRFRLETASPSLVTRVEQVTA